MSDAGREAARIPRECARVAETADGLAESVQELQAELVACQRLALLGSMAAMVAHEFNNLLTPILARTEAALTEPMDEAFVRKTLERTLSQAQWAMGVARHLLDLVHDSDHPLESCSVADAVREAIETMARPFEKDGITLEVEVAPELHVRARLDLLCQVLLNLLLNARRAMQGHTGVLRVSAATDGEMVRIEVRDSGVGIPADVLKERINPFLAADPQARPHDWQHVGLGLNVCRMIAHRHGAELRGYANETRGCTFRLRWPAAAGQPTGHC